MKALLDLFWERAPKVGSRLSPTLGVVLSDGRELTRWPRAAAAVPLGAFLLGLLLGWLRPQLWETFTLSLLLMGTMLAIAGLGAALGFWEWLGFVIGDFLLYDRLPAFGSLVDTALRVWGALLISYILLWGLLVGVPLAAAAFRQRAVSRLGSGRARLAVGAAFQVGLAAVFTTMWTFVTPQLIRPVWTFREQTPPVTAIAPVQLRGWVLVLVAGAAAAARLLLERAARARGGAPVSAPPIAPPRSGHVRKAIVAALQASVLTLVLSGLLENFGQAALVWGTVFGIVALRAFVYPRLPTYGRLVNRVPLLLRLLLVGAAGLGFGLLLLPAAYQQADQSFFRMVLALVLGLVVAGLLLPPEPEPALRREGRK